MEVLADSPSSSSSSSLAGASARALAPAPAGVGSGEVGAEGVGSGGETGVARFAAADERADACAAFALAGMVVVELERIGPSARGRLGDVIDEAIEHALGARGAAAPGIASNSDRDAILSDQLFRARRAGATGLAIVLGPLSAAVGSCAALEPEDCAVLSYLARAARERPLSLILDATDAETAGYGVPLPLRVLLPHEKPSRADEAVEAATTPAPEPPTTATPEPATTPPVLQTSPNPERSSCGAGRGAARSRRRMRRRLAHLDPATDRRPRTSATRRTGAPLCRELHATPSRDRLGTRRHARTPRSRRVRRSFRQGVHRSFHDVRRDDQAPAAGTRRARHRCAHRAAPRGPLDPPVARGLDAVGRVAPRAGAARLQARASRVGGGRAPALERPPDDDDATARGRSPGAWRLCALRPRSRATPSHRAGAPPSTSAGCAWVLAS